MKDLINYSEFIERYLDGEMAPDELAWFKKEMEGDPRLGDEIQLRREVNEALEEKDIIQLRMQLGQIHENLKAGQQKKKAPAYRFRTIMAGTASIAVMALFLLIAGKQWLVKPGAEDLFRQYYEPYEMPVYREGNTETDLLFLEAMETYRNREFDRAIVLFEEVLTEDGSKMDANLMTGISKIETERYREANYNFQRIIDHRDNLFIEQAEWYLGLSCLMAGEEDKAIGIFTSIREGQGAYRKEAREILRKIR